MSVTVEVDDGLALVTLDDGAQNVFNPTRFEELITVLDDAGDEVTGFVLTGREGMFSAGLDLKFMQAEGRDGVRRLLVAFGKALMRWWTEPRPTVCAATGHAIAAGTMLAMACDHAVAADGKYWWGLTETQIDFAMPRFGLTLARHNVRTDRLDDLILPGRRIAAYEAVEVGYADELAPPEEVLDRAIRHARTLTQLPPTAYAATKQRLRGAAAQHVLDGLEADLDDMDAFLGT